MSLRIGMPDGASARFSGGIWLGGLRANLYSAQHAARHDEVGRDYGAGVEGPDPPWTQVSADPRTQPRPFRAAEGFGMWKTKRSTQR
jgi:hypothetical protein